MSKEEYKAAYNAGANIGLVVGAIAVGAVVIACTVGGFIAFNKYSLIQKITFILFLVNVAWLLIDSISLKKINAGVDRAYTNKVRVVKNGFKSWEETTAVGKYEFGTGFIVLLAIFYVLFNIGVINLNKPAEFKPYFAMITGASIVVNILMIIYRRGVNKEILKSNKILNIDHQGFSTPTEGSANSLQNFVEPKQLFIPFCVVSGISTLLFTIFLIINLVQ